jgi:hypothetical protein
MAKVTRQVRAEVSDISPPPAKISHTPCYRISTQVPGFNPDVLQGVGVDSKESVLRVAQARAAQLQQQWEADSVKRGHPRGSRPIVKVWMLVAQY